MRPNPERAARLFGAAEALFESIGVHVPPGDRPDYERSIAATRVQMDKETFASLRAQGRAMPLDQVIALAFNDD